MYDYFKKFAFGIDPELAHNKTIEFAHYFPFASKVFCQEKLENKKYTVQFFDKNWSFPVGLAAGLDKNAQAVNFFSHLLFGAIEVGTVTPLAQPGNDKPRLFRLEGEKSLRNRLGFNNLGMEKIYKNILKSRKNKIIGINLGKNKITNIDDAYLDYQKLYEKFSPIADYLVINVSSPNTPGLRNLGAKEKLIKILDSLKDLRSETPAKLFIKVSPDMSFEMADDILTLVQDYRLQGIIGTNTTIIPEYGKGGISGDLLYSKAQVMRSYLLSKMNQMNGAFFIGVGGFSNFSQIKDFWSEGGSLIQVYTSFIYQGPALLKNIAKEIDQFLLDEKLNSLQQYFDQR